MKYANYIILFILLSTAFIFKDSISLSTNLLSLFAPKESIEKLSIATELGYTKELLIAVKGFDKSSQETVEELVTKLKYIESIKQIQYKITPSDAIQKYYRDNFVLLSEFNASIQDSKTINKKLKELQYKQMNGLFYTPIDKNDPLKLFTLKNINKSINSNGKYITLGDYGYLLNIKTDVSPSQMKEAKNLYKKIKEITETYPEVIAFSGFFYTVENSTKIKEDVLLIAVISALILLIIYLVLFRNIRILFHTIIALFSSTLFASLVTLLCFDNFHVISLAFGMSITAVSIDYLFHYYFHDFYSQRKKIDTNVLYGFLTTLSAFGIFSFIPVPLISQISFFTLLSLSFSYFLFTFVFKGLNIKRFDESLLDTKSYSKIPSYLVLIISLLLLTYSFFNIKLDYNIRNLDYDNKELRLIENIFKDSAKKKLYPVLVQASSDEELIHRLHLLNTVQKETFSLASFVIDKEECRKRKNLLESYNFDALNILLNEEAAKLGYRETYFKEAYKFTSKLSSCSIPDLDMFETYNLSVIEKNNRLYSIAFVHSTQDAEKYSFVSSINVKDMFSKVSNQMYKDIAKYSSLVVVMILVLLFLSVRKRFFYAINYILFPLSITLAILVAFIEINIMHIFSFIILIAIGIDYGIYMSNTKKQNNTMMAIKYSLLSTFGAFGVLVFSSISALHSIGLVISLGVASIFLLMKVVK